MRAITARSKTLNVCREIIGLWRERRGETGKVIYTSNLKERGAAEVGNQGKLESHSQYINTGEGEVLCQKPKEVMRVREGHAAHVTFGHSNGNAFWFARKPL